MPYSWLEGRASRLELKRPSHMARRKPHSEDSRATPQKEPDISVSILSLAFFCESNKTYILFKLSYVGDSVMEKLMVTTAISNGSIHDNVPGTGLQPLNPQKNRVMWALLFSFYR